MSASSTATAAGRRLRGGLQSEKDQKLRGELQHSKEDSPGNAEKRRR